MFAPTPAWKTFCRTIWTVRLASLRSIRNHPSTIPIFAVPITTTRKPRKIQKNPGDTEKRKMMLTQPTIEKLVSMRLRGMADAFREQQESVDSQRLSFEERLGLLIDRHWNWRQNLALERRLRNGRLQGSACIEDI